MLRTACQASPYRNHWVLVAILTPLSQPHRLGVLDLRSRQPPTHPVRTIDGSWFYLLEGGAESVRDDLGSWHGQSLVIIANPNESRGSILHF